MTLILTTLALATHTARMLADLHPHPKDGLVRFESDGHVYFYVPTGQPVPKSVTGLLKPFFDTFDGAAVANQYFDRWLADDGHKYHALCNYLTLCRRLTHTAAEAEICALWSAMGGVAAAEGTRVHALLEEHVNARESPLVCDCTEGDDGSDGMTWPVAQFERFMASFHPDMGLQPWRTEFACVYTTERADGTQLPVVCGTVDLLLRDRMGRIWVVDYKTTNPKKKGLLGPAPKRKSQRWTDRLAWPFEGVEASEFGKYSAQLGVYSWILRKCYDMDVAGAFILQVHETMDAPHVVEALDLDDRVNLLMEAERERALCENAFCQHRRDSD